MDKLIILAIQTEDGFFVKDHRQDGDYAEKYQVSSLKGYFFDGVQAKPTFSPLWLKIATKPTRIHILQNQSNINHRFELIDKSLESDKFPLVFAREAVAEPGECTYSSWIWKSEFQHFQSLYEEKSDPQPTIEVDQEFEFRIILVVDNIKEYADFSFSRAAGRYESDGKINVTAKSITHQVIDKIIFPEPILPSKPCSLSSKETYGIIREYIKNNINPKAAEITSDYDFCFTVKKKVKLAKPYTHKWENKKDNGKSYRPPRINQKFVENRNVEVFEMTHAESKYQGYTVIEGFRGDNQDDLKKNIDTYLEELINYINVPLMECSCCNGVGVLEEAKK
ncbi:MAG: hypothetical protein WC390_06380 [Sulfurimonas sp.]|jgi:hypothetical protein